MRPVFGEEVWLKTSQTSQCRLYGCVETGNHIIIFKDARVELPPRAMFCAKHAEAIAGGELHVGGVVPAPRTKGES